MTQREPAPEWKVRPMLPRDVDLVASVEAQIYPFPWSRGNFLDSLKAGYDTWVFESGPTLLGYAIVMWIPDEVHLLNLSVAAPWQGRGLGRAFLEWLCRHCASRGARSLMLEVRPTNAHARALYETMQFRQIGLRKRYYPSFNNTREDALVLSRELTHE